MSGITAVFAAFHTCRHSAGQKTAEFVFNFVCVRNDEIIIVKIFYGGHTHVRAWTVSNRRAGFENAVYQGKSCVWLVSLNFGPLTSCVLIRCVLVVKKW